MDFIKGLHEARMTRNSQNQRVLTYTDCCERLYLILLAIEVINHFPKRRPQAMSYAKQTVSRDNFKHFRMGGTDLYNFIYFVNGDEDALSKLKSPKNAQVLRKQTTLNTMAVNRYLHQIGNGLATQGVSETFMALERNLRITNADYKAIRRGAIGFNRLSFKDKQDVATRLVIAARAKLRSSDFIPYLEDLVSDFGLETSRVADNEPTISVPDITPTGRDLQMYRYFVGQKNLMQAKKFLELAKDGKSVPSQFVQGYLPAIKMLDDIVKAGPAYVQAVRNVHQRAKKARNS